MFSLKLAGMAAFRRGFRSLAMPGALAMMAALAAPAIAAPTVIDFTEPTAQGIPSYTKFGVTFTSGGPPGSVTLVEGANGTGNLLGNYVEDPNDPDNGFFDVMRADFTGVVGMVSVDLGDFPSTFRGEGDAEKLFLGAYDAFDVFITSASTFIDEDQVAYTTLSVSGPGIKYVLFGSAGGFSGSSIYADNFTFDTAVPEPSTWAMMILGFGAAGTMIRRRRVLAV